MPIVEQSNYRAPWFMPGGHLQTIVPNLSRARLKFEYERERLELADGDFVDVDWLRGDVRSRSLVIILHGLEGNSRAPYIVPLAKAAQEAGHDVAALNFRGCSGEMNRRPRFYHSGDTADLHFLIRSVERFYETISLVGFSLGGNVVLKYLGAEDANVSKKVACSVTFSVPCDLASSAVTLGSWDNVIYMKRFMRMLCAKLEQKVALGHDLGLDISGCRSMKTFAEFDNEYTAPLHGFESAADYWARSSSLQFLGAIRRPSLLVNARNDPFLPTSCYPADIAESSRCFFLEMPETGGHCGFPGRERFGYWFVWRALEFMQSAADK